VHVYALVLVLFSAILHATWNAQLKDSGDRARFMLYMCLAVGTVAAFCVAFLPLPARAAWWCVGLSSLVHIVYNLLLLENYRKSDLSSAYPIARGISPVLVTLGGFLLMQQRPSGFATAGVVMISTGIVFLSTEKASGGKSATLSALATGSIIGTYTVIDGMGVQRAGNTLSYTTWVFASYLLMPPLLMLFRVPLRPESTRTVVRAAGAGMFSLAAYTLVLWATHYVEVGIVSALRETSVLWAILFGRAFLGESLTWRRMTSAIVISSGVMLLVWTSR
jgi:drug/metabolite transporter (DMT)-like permease